MIPIKVRRQVELLELFHKEGYLQDDEGGWFLEGGPIFDFSFFTLCGITAQAEKTNAFGCYDFVINPGPKEIFLAKDWVEEIKSTPNPSMCDTCYEDCKREETRCDEWSPSPELDCRACTIYSDCTLEVKGFGCSGFKRDPEFDNLHETSLKLGSQLQEYKTKLEDLTTRYTELQKDNEYLVRELRKANEC